MREICINFYYVFFSIECLTECTTDGFIERCAFFYYCQYWYWYHVPHYIYIFVKVFLNVSNM